LQGLCQALADWSAELRLIRDRTAIGHIIGTKEGRSRMRPRAALP
jgi:hypothetical protein